jgi:hypothetical protein
VIDAATGRAVRDTRVFLVPPKVSPDSIAAREVSSRDGDFEFRDVTPGAYRVFAVTRDSQNAMSGRIPIRVEDLDLRGLSLPVRKDFQVAGRLTLDDTALSNRIDGSQAIVILNAGSRGTIDGSLHGFVPENGPDAVIPPLRAAVQPDGTFVFKGVRSWTYVADVLQSRLYVKAILSGEKDLLRVGEPVDLIDISDLNIVLGSDSGMLEGHAMAHAIVVAVPDEPSRGRRDIYRTAKSRRLGTFQLPCSCTRIL